MKILDRYILAQLLSAFVSGLVMFLGLMFMFQMLRLSDLFIQSGTPIGQLMRVMSYRLFADLPMGIIVAFLVGVLMVFSRLSSDSELVAMKAGGYSLKRLSAPVFGFALLVSLVSLLMNLTWVPSAEVSFRRQMNKIGNQRFTSAIREGTFNSGLGGLLVYTEKSNPKTGRMSRVFIFDDRNKSQPLTVVSHSGDMVRVVDEYGDLSGMVLQLQDGALHQTDVNSSDYSKTDFGVYQIAMDLVGAAGGLGGKPKMLGFYQLLDQVKEQSSRADLARYRELLTELWRRISVGWSPLLFVLLGIGFGTTRTRGAKTSVILVSVVSLAVYWQLQVTGIYWGAIGAAHPAITLQLPNAVLLIVGAYFYKKASW